MKNKKTSALALVFCSLLVACSSTGNQQLQQADNGGAPALDVSVVDRAPYSNVHAVFDSEKQTVQTPLDKYVHSADEHIIIETANFYSLKQCVTGKGQPITHHFYQTEYRSDIPFGVWSPTFAERYGYEIHNTLGKVYVDDGYIGEDTIEMRQAFESCHEEVDSQAIPVFIKGVSASTTAETAILSETVAQVSSLTSNDSDVKSAIEEWTQCLDEQGVSLDSKYDQPIAVIPDDKEAQIKQALIDVRCKEDTRLMERFYDAQSQYEQALIEKNQAAFNKLGEQKEAYLEEARKVLRQNGITL